MKTEQTQQASRPGRGLVIDLAEVGAEMLPDVGGKAAQLGVLLAAGLPVPPGFCVTTTAYLRVTGPVGLRDRLADAALPTPRPRPTPRPDAADTAQRPAASDLARDARDLVLGAPVPADIVDAVVAAYSALGRDLPVAVRSSATAEDLPFASFAGQQDTFLGVVGADAVLDAVRRCWASLWTDRAVAYRETNGIDHWAVSIAVVVQVMVDAAVAGVLFTANPVTGRRREAVIDASPGLGEAVVSGAVNPDHFVVDAETGAITERRIGDKRMVIRSKPGGGTVRIELEDGTDTACLTDRQVRDLAALGDGSSPSTAHHRTPSGRSTPEGGSGSPRPGRSRRSTRCRPGGPAGRAPGSTCAPASPRASPGRSPRWAWPAFGWSPRRWPNWRTSRCADPFDGPPAYAEAGQRLFIDLTPVLRSRIGREIVPRAFDVMEARSAIVLRGLFDDPRFSVVTTSPWPFLRRVGPIAAHFDVPLQAAPGPDPARGRDAPRAPLRRPPHHGAGRARRPDAGATPRLRRTHPRPGAVPDRSRHRAGAGARLRDARRRPQAAGRPRRAGGAADRAPRASAQRDHRDGPRALAARDPDPRRRRRGPGLPGRTGRGPRQALRRRHPAAGRPVRARRLPAPLRPPRRGGDRSRDAALAGRSDPYPRRARQLPPADRPGCGTGPGVRVGGPAGRGRRWRAWWRRPAAAAGCAGGWSLWR